MWAVMARELSRYLAAVLAVGSAAVIALWRVARPVLRWVAQLLLALVVVFEEWGWQPLSAALGRLARFRPWAAVEVWLAGLPPYGALAAFAIPITLLFPLKLVAVYLFTTGKFVLGTLLLIGAKLTSTAFVARIFMLTKPALMQIGWFAWGYAKFVPWEEEAMRRLRASWAWRAGRVLKHRAGRMAHKAWEAARPKLQAVFADVRLWWDATWPKLRAAARRAASDARDRVTDLVRRLFGQVL